MTSIFIWKSPVANTSKTYIKYYSGSNWVLEDNNYSSKSYVYLDQIVIPGFNDSVITFNVKNMPRDWIGSDLLEVTDIQYELIKSDDYGTFERIGNWNRFTLKKNILYTMSNLQDEFERIKVWIDIQPPTKDVKSKYIEKPYNKYRNNDNVQTNSLNTNSLNTNNRNNGHNRIDPIDPIDINTIHTNFQDFYNKYIHQSNVVHQHNVDNNSKHNSNHKNNHNKIVYRNNKSYIKINHDV